MPSSSRRRLLLAALALLATGRTDAAALRRLIWCGIPSGAPDVDAIAKRHWATMFAPHGFVPGRTLQIEVVRPSMASPAPDAQWEAIARRVVASAPGVVLVNYNWVAVFRPLTRDLPIVFVGMIDPEYHGSIESARRPGGNVTGALVPFFEAQEKRIELVKQMRPGARRVAVVHHSGPYDEKILQRIVDVARRLGMEGFALAVDDSAIEGRVASAVRAARADIVDLLIADRLMHPETYRQLLQLGVASSVQNAGTVKAGALLTYEPVGVEEIAVDLAARILRGERPATLPARQASEFRLSINARTARALGLAMPEAVLLRAYEVFE